MDGIELLSFPALVVALPLLVQHMKQAVRAFTQWLTKIKLSNAFVPSPDREFASGWPLVTDIVAVGAAFLARESGILPVASPNAAATVVVGLVIGVVVQGGYNLSTGRGVLGMFASPAAAK